MKCGKLEGLLLLLVPVFKSGGVGMNSKPTTHHLLGLPRRNLSGLQFPPLPNKSY